MSSAKNYNILLFWFNDDWGKYGRAYEMTALHLAKLPEVRQVVCVFPERNKTDGKAGGLIERRINAKLSLVTERAPRQPKRSGVLAGMLCRARGKQQDSTIKKFFSERGFTADDTILWLFPPHPYINRLLKLIPRRLTVAHVIDNFTHFDKSHFLYPYAVEQYPTIGQWADVILTTSESNRVAFSSAGVPCHRIPLAVDESFIASPSELPSRATGARPRLGYLGFIMERTDLDIVRGIAIQRPDWDIVLAGPEYPKGLVKEYGLLELANVHWVGEISNSDAPQFLQSLDVCLLPHKDNDYSRSMGPLKLHQYLGSGRPVISTPVAGIENVEDQLRIAKGAGEFVHEIQAALENDSIEDSRARINCVRSETWDVRARQMLDAVTQGA